MSFKYRELAKKITYETLKKFYLEQKNIFQKSLKIIAMFFLTQ